MVDWRWDILSFVENVIVATERVGLEGEYTTMEERLTVCRAASA